MRRRRKVSSGEPATDLEPADEREEGVDRRPPPIPVGWGNLVTDSLRIEDPAALGRRLREDLEIGDGRTEYGVVLEAMDRSAHNLDAATRLFRAAKIEEEKYEIATAARLSVLRERAMEELQAEYVKKLRKSPTLQDIEDRIMKHWPDEYRAIRVRKAELHGTVRTIEGLVHAWSSRCADLRVMADKARPR
jgi:hypothetical protein